MRGLYAIVDVEAVTARGFDPVAFADAALASKPAALQLRDKRHGARATLELLRAIAPLAARAGVPFFANDRPDLALVAKCDGVHVGQDDLPVAAVRKIAAASNARLLVGYSTHREDQVEAALREPLDYLAIGPVRRTASKRDHDPELGVDRVKAIAARVREAAPALPIVAIGGVDLELAKALAKHVDCIAVIGALADASSLDDVSRRAMDLVTALETSR